MVPNSCSQQPVTPASVYSDAFVLPLSVFTRTYPNSNIAVANKNKIRSLKQSPPLKNICRIAFVYLGWEESSSRDEVENDMIIMYCNASLRMIAMYLFNGRQE